MTSFSHIPLAVVQPPRPTLATIYRPFFLTAMALALTAGAGLGVLLLLRIGAAGSFTGVPIHDINAHGHAQIMGWVGLFIMGFAYQAFPRMWQVPLPLPRLAIVVWVTMLATIVARMSCLRAHDAPWAWPTHAVAAALQTLAIWIFVAQIGVILWRRRQTLAPAGALIGAALFFMALQSVWDGWHHAALLAATTRNELLGQLATYQAPLRDLQLHGMATLMILGVGVRMFPAMFGVAPTPPRRAWWGTGLLIGAVLLEVWLFLSFRIADQRAFAAALLLPWLMLPIGAWLIVGPWRPWRRFPSPGGDDRSAKFVRASLIWLFVALAMLLLTPVYLIAYSGSGGDGFSHAWYGAVRQALAVGFVTMMIVGVAAKVVPTLNGIDTRRLTPLWGPFILLNLGCTLHVGMQVVTDWQSWAFRLVGVGGVLELTAIAWWAAHLTTIIVRGRATRTVTETAAPSADSAAPSTPTTDIDAEPACCGACASRRTVAAPVTVMAAGG